VTGAGDPDGAPPTSPTPQRLDPPEAGRISGRLFPSLPTEAEWDLERLHTLLEELDRPHLCCPSLHVGGTNGKGSVATVWDSILREDGRRVGLYTSPHLWSFAERFRIDGRATDEERLLEAAAEIREGVVRHGLTFFEASTVLAFHLFRKEDVEVAVLEVGLGGRLDATNVVRPEVCAVTNVALDHTEFLGDTLEQVAREKAGIAKEGVPLVTAETDPEIVEILRREATSRGARFHFLDEEERVGEPKTDFDGSRFQMKTDSWGEVLLETPLVGAHQIRNVALAVRALDLIDGPLRPDESSVVDGVRRARWPGRFEVRREEGRTWIYDVAHNVEGTKALLQTAEVVGIPEPRVVVFGCLADKDWHSMLDLLRSWADRAVLVPPPGAPAGRAWDPVGARDAFAGWAEVTADVAAALDRARELAGSGGSVLVTGSHRLVGAALAAAGGL